MMRIAIFLIIVISSCSKRTIIYDAYGNAEFKYLQDSQIELAPPKIKVDSFLFKESSSVEMSFDLEDANILYAIGEEEFKEYHDPISINKSSTLKVKVQKRAYKESETIFVQVVKVSDKLAGAEISITPQASNSYPGNGATSLIDLQKGTLNFKQGNQWLGFQSKKVDIDVDFPIEKEITQVCLSLLSDEKSWIFRPEKIFLVLDKDTLSALMVPKTKKNELANSNSWCVPLAEKEKCTDLKIVIESMEEIPSWHDGKGTPPWLFIDEIIVK